MQKVMIIGSAGAGKSTLARILGARTGLPVVHLDKEFWNPGWVQTPRAEWIEKQERLLAGDRWIVDGNYGGTMDVRIALADTIVFMDFGRTVCLYNVMKRWLTHIGKTRVDMAEGCPEKIDAEFIRWVWDFPKRSRPEILRKIEANQDKKTVTLKTRGEVKRFLESL
jgi:adenylate kinase family enzyme